MIDLTPDAKERFELYLGRMRSALRGSRAVEASEVEQNVREHVEIALAGATGPVDAERLGEVLAQLGPPERWLTDDDRPWWSRTLHTISHGPEDWRLSYLAFGAFALSLLLLPIGVGVFVLIAAFALSRATVELIHDRGEILGARRWLVLPAIWIVLLGVVLPLLIAPVAGISSLFLDDLDAPEGYEQIRFHAGVIGMVAGAWWLVMAGVFAALMKPFRALFYPVSANLTRKHAVVLALVAIMVGAIGAAVFFANGFV